MADPGVERGATDVVLRLRADADCLHGPTKDEPCPVCALLREAADELERRWEALKVAGQICDGLGEYDLHDLAHIVHTESGGDPHDPEPTLDDYAEAFCRAAAFASRADVDEGTVETLRIVAERELREGSSYRDDVLAIADAVDALRTEVASLRSRLEGWRPIEGWEDPETGARWPYLGVAGPIKVHHLSHAVGVARCALEGVGNVTVEEAAEYCRKRLDQMDEDLAREYRPVPRTPHEQPAVVPAEPSPEDALERARRTIGAPDG